MNEANEPKFVRLTILSYTFHTLRPTCVTNVTFVSNELKKEEFRGELRDPRAPNFRLNLYNAPSLPFFSFTCMFCFLHNIIYVSVSLLSRHTHLRLNMRLYRLSYEVNSVLSRCHSYLLEHVC